jgi:hypothetical protein
MGKTHRLYTQAFCQLSGFIKIAGFARQFCQLFGRMV